MLVLERADARWAARSRPTELTLPGFRHDTFSSVYPAAVASPVFARWPLERHGLRWVPPAATATRTRCPTGARWCWPATSTRRPRRSTRCTRATATRWRPFVSPYVERFGACGRRCCRGFPPLPGRCSSLAALAAGRHAGLRAAAADAGAGARPRAVPRRRRPRVAVRRGDARRRAAGRRRQRDRRRLPQPPGPRGRLAEPRRAAPGGWPTRWPAICAALGGRTRTSAPVARVAAERGRVIGVALEDGERLLAPAGDRRRHAARRCSRLAGDALARRYAAALRRFRYGPATLKVDWALAGPVPWTAPEAREAGTVHVGGSEQRDARRARAGSSGELPERPLLLFGQQSVADPTRAPAGQAHRLGLHARSAWRPLGAREPSGSSSASRRRSSASRRASATASWRRHVQSPADLERRNANLVGGDVGAGCYALDQVIFRPCRA